MNKYNRGKILIFIGKLLGFSVQKEASSPYLLEIVFTSWNKNYKK